MLSTVWIPQRCLWSYTEKRGGRNETEVARRIKGGSKGERQIQPVTMFPKCSPSSGTHRKSELGREEKGEGRDRGHLVEKKESPKEERVVKPVISLSGRIG